MNTEGGITALQQRRLFLTKPVRRLQLALPPPPSATVTPSFRASLSPCDTSVQASHLHNVPPDPQRQHVDPGDLLLHHLLHRAHAEGVAAAVPWRHTTGLALACALLLFWGLIAQLFQSFNKPDWKAKVCVLTADNRNTGDLWQPSDCDTPDHKGPCDLSRLIRAD